jgi:hypothetical protein
MQFQCDSEHKFHYPSKLTIMINSLKITGEQYDSLESSVCPFCQSKTFTEYVEPVEVDSVLEDMQLVEWDLVSTFITKGYVELDRKDHVFAKGVIMLKTKPTAPENAAPIVMRQEKDYISEALETAAAEKVKQP